MTDKTVDAGRVCDVYLQWKRERVFVAERPTFDGQATLLALIDDTITIIDEHVALTKLARTKQSHGCCLHNGAPTDAATGLCMTCGEPPEPPFAPRSDTERGGREGL